MSDFNNQIIGMNKGGEKKKIQLSELFFKYFSHFPLFIISLVLSLTIVHLIIRYDTPMYNASVQVLVADDQSQKASGQQNDIVNQALTGVKPINIENELEFDEGVISS